MSLFNWFTGKKKPEKAAPASSGLSRMDSTKPVNAAARQSLANAQPANRKHERMARRELLYTVVREAMVRAGILTSSYKFKVLSLDTRGRQFLVMVDLAHGAGGETARLAEVEALIAQAAKARHDILVTAVYWRSNEHVAVGEPLLNRPHGRATPSRPTPLDSHPAVLDSQPPALDANSHPAELVSAPPERHPAPRYEPLQADEVAAFQRALAAGVAAPAAAAAAAVRAPAAVRGEAALAATAAAPARPAAPAATAATAASAKPAAPTTAATPASAAAAAAHGSVARDFDGSAKHGPQSYTLLTGFEDTEMPESDAAAAALSATQYGDLR